MEDLKIGDMLLYQKDTQKICHRLVRKINDGKRFSLYVRGDNSLPASECITEEMYSGKAVGTLKNGRVVDLASREYQFINRIIVFIAPIISRGNRIIKPLYDKFLWRMRRCLP